MLFTEEGRPSNPLPKVEGRSFAQIARFNSEVQVTAHIADIVPATIAPLMQGAGSYPRRHR